MSVIRQRCASSGSYKIPSWRRGCGVTLREVAQCEIVIGNSVFYAMFKFGKNKILRKLYRT